MALARPSGSAATGDGAPSGMVAYFASGSACPTGWVIADEVAGRMVVGVSDVNNIGLRVGTPLADQEDRAHMHSFTATTSIPSKNLAAADGSNNSAAQSGGVTSDGMAGAATTGLPFTQLIVCKKP